MEKTEEEKYVRAGRIAAKVREESRTIVKPGMKFLDIAEEIEEIIRKEGAEPAFPVNISVNDVAAHYTPTRIDESKVMENDIVKVDVGVHIDGYVADTALTINFNQEYKDLVKAAENALDEAIKEVRPEARLSDVSTAIENTIKGMGFKPVENLTGHGLDRWDLHSNPTIPNVSFTSSYRLKEGQVIAIEPFATDGAGYVKDSENVFIFMLLDNKPVRSQEARKIMEFGRKFNNLPFAERWIPIESVFKTRMALRELRERGNLHDFYVLKEAKGGMVSQAEHSLIVKEKPLVITQI